MPSTRTSLDCEAVDEQRSVSMAERQGLHRLLELSTVYTAFQRGISRSDASDRMRLRLYPDLGSRPLRVLARLDRGKHVRSLEAADGFPLAWHTAPLFRAVDYDVATFRPLGAFILVTPSGILGAVAVRSGTAASTPAIDELRAGAGHRVRMALGAVVGGLGGMLPYGGLVRVPGYNWENVVGATIAAIRLFTPARSRIATAVASVGGVRIDPGTRPVRPGGSQLGMRGSKKESSFASGGMQSVEIRPRAIFQSREQLLTPPHPRVRGQNLPRPIAFGSESPPLRSEPQVRPLRPQSSVAQSWHRLANTA